MAGAGFRDAGAGGLESGEGWRATPWLPWAVLAAFACGVPIDGLLVLTLGNAAPLALGAPVAVLAVWRVVGSGRLRPLPAALLALMAYALWSTASVVWATDVEGFEKRVLTNLQLLALVLLCWQVVRSRGDLVAVLVGFLAGCLVNVALAWNGFLAGQPLYEGGTRYAARGIDANDMSVTLAIGMPMAAYLAFAGGRRWHLAALLYLPAAGSAIALSGSRGGSLTALVAVVAIAAWLARRTLPGLVLASALLVGGLAVAWKAVPEGTWERVFSIQQQLASGSIGDRAQIWRAGLQVFARHPFAGVGAGGFPAAVLPILNERIVAHNTPLSIAVEHGLVGLALFGAALAFALRDARAAAPDERALARSLVAVWCVGCASLTWEYRKTTWLVLLVAVALGALHRARTRSEAQ